MEWIDFNPGVHGDPEGIYKPLVRAWWEGQGFVGRCPSCRNWIRFTIRRMEAIPEDRAEPFLKLPENWHSVAQFA